MDYSEQIKSPKWQKKRLDILKRDKFTCQDCGDKEQTLHVHHKHYNKGAKIWEYENWELTTLCENCHLINHESYFKNIINVLKFNYDTPEYNFIFNSLLKISNENQLSDFWQNLSKYIDNFGSENLSQFMESLNENK